MIHGQNTRFVSITPPAAIVNNNSYTTASIDTQGYDYLEVFVYVGATDIAMTALKLQESDTDGSYADVTGLVYGTSASIAGTTAALPTATDDNKCFKFEVDLRGRKRYFDLVATAGNGSTGTFLTAFALLSRAKDTPVTASERNLGNVVRLPA
jgi:hypothetical protein